MVRNGEIRESETTKLRWYKVRKLQPAKAIIVRAEKVKRERTVYLEPQVGTSTSNFISIS